MQIAGRDAGRVAKSVVDRRHYTAARNMMRLYDHPMDMFRRYLTGPRRPFRTIATGPRHRNRGSSFTLYSSHDLLTVNEIFCRDDYHADADDTVVVDFGSNIGISAAYFLSRSPDVIAYLFEPLPSTNTERLQAQPPSPFEGHYTLGGSRCRPRGRRGFNSAGRKPGAMAVSVPRRGTP